MKKLPISKQISTFKVANLSYQPQMFTKLFVDDISM